MKREQACKIVASKTMDTVEAAALLHKSRQQVQRMAHDGKLPAKRVGQTWLFNRAAMYALVGIEG